MVQAECSDHIVVSPARANRNDDQVCILRVVLTHVFARQSRMRSTETTWYEMDYENRGEQTPRNRIGRRNSPRLWHM